MSGLRKNRPALQNGWQPKRLKTKLPGHKISKDKTTKHYDDLVQLDIKDLTKRLWIGVHPVAGSSLEALHLKASREIRGIAKNVQ